MKAHIRITTILSSSCAISSTSFSRNSPGNESGRIDLTQENIAEILTVTRVNAARNLGRLRDERIIVPHRRWIEIIDQQALEDYCSEETLQA